MTISDRFPLYTEYEPQVPVWIVTPGHDGCIHRFFSSSPFSPSGRYLAVLQLPQEERMPEPGETANVLLVDLETAETRAVAETRGWEPQTGANLNWGADDSQLFFNDADTSNWKPHGVKLNPLTGEKMRLDGCIYHVSPDGKRVLAASMEKMRRTQFGYGVVIPDELVPINKGFPEDDGLWMTDTAAGECKLLISLRETLDKLGDKLQIGNPENGAAYVFHSEWSPQGDRLFFTIRWVPPGEKEWNSISDDLSFNILTLRPDGSELHAAVTASYWKKGGHHTHWQPDGEWLSMNLGYYGNGMKFCQARYDGAGIGPIIDSPPGSGHPTVHPDGRHILTDTYTHETGGGAFGDGTVPLRWVDIKEKTERCLARFNTAQASPHGCLRVDPHPAWDRSWRYAAFNSFLDGTRRVLITDLSGLIE